jgi:membrane protein YdbS with pleckstrin-like domain
MTFTNPEVDLAALPAAESVTLQPVHRRYRGLLRIEWAITAALLVAIAAALIFFLPGLRDTYGWIFIAAAALLLIGFYLLMVEKAFPHMAYAVRDNDILYQSGWIFRTLRICPFNRVQNCSVRSGPLERKAALATLVLYTAGSEGADMRIPGLLQEEADRLRQFILSKIHTERAEG